MARDVAAGGHLLARPRTWVFLALAAYIAAGPFLSQIAGLSPVLFRPWTMYSAVGNGILDGSFTVTRADRTVETLSPLELLGMERYPRVTYYEFESRVLSDDDLGRVVAAFCAGLGEGDRLEFEGRVGAAEGWRALWAEDLCGGAAK